MSEPIVLKNAFLIDGNGGDPVEGATVAVEDGNIIDVTYQGDVKAPGSRVIDLHGKTLMPGLMDAHVHIGNIEMDLNRTSVLPPAVYVMRAARNLETDLNLGFTTLRDAGGLDYSFRQAVDQGLINGPRLMLSVNMLTQTGGHGDKRGAGREKNVPRNSLGSYPEICDGPDEVRKAAREVLRKGADQIKVMADGGVASPSDKPGQWQYTVEELKAAVETAQAAGTYVMAHVYTSNAVKNCLEAGVKSIEHGNLLTAADAAAMAEKGSFLVPTLTVYEVLAREGEKQGMDAFVMEKVKQVRQTGLDALESAYRAGVSIASGTDIIGPFQYLKGREFAIKGEIMTPMETIVSATRTNAELMNIDDMLGTVEPGKRADLIVMNGNPLDDLSLFEQGLKTVSLVIKNGLIVKDLLGAG